jgi:hypothetical protein
MKLDGNDALTKTKLWLLRLHQCEADYFINSRNSISAFFTVFHPLSVNEK